jgi:putative ABC transport system permease protein
LLLSISLEAGLIGFLGSIGGVLLGSLGLLVLADIIGIPITILIPLWLIIGAILITTLLSMILGLFPAWFAVNRGVAEALGNE